MINELIKLAVHLDSEGYYREANYVDEMIKQSSIEIDTDRPPGIPIPGAGVDHMPAPHAKCHGEGGLLSDYGLENLELMTRRVILNKIKKYQPGSSKGNKIVSLMEAIEAKSPDRKWTLSPQLDYSTYYDVFKSLMLSVPLYAYYKRYPDPRDSDRDSDEDETRTIASFRGPPLSYEGFSGYFSSGNKREKGSPPSGSWEGRCIGIYFNAGHKQGWTNLNKYMPTIEHEVEHAVTGAMYATYGFNRNTSQKGKLRRLLPDPTGDIETKETDDGTKRAVHDEQLAEMHVELMGLSKFLVENNLGTSSEPFNSKIVEALCPTIPYDASDPMILKILLGLYGGHIDEFGSWQTPTGDDPEGFFEDDSWGRDMQARLENAACNNDLNQMLEDFNTLALAPAAEQVNTPEEVGAVYSSGVVSGLIKLAVHLDNEGYYREANYVDEMVRKEAGAISALKKIMPSWTLEGYEKKIDALTDRLDELEAEPRLTDDIIELEEIETMCEEDGEGSEACQEADVLFEELEEEWGEGFEEDYKEDYSVDQNARFVSSSFQNYSDGNYRGSCYYQGSDGVYFTVEFTGPMDEARPSCGGRGSSDPIPDGKVTYHD